MSLNPFADIKFEEFGASNNPPNNDAWANSFSQWGGGIGASLDSPPAWGNPPPVAA
jgi:hypothetical protein